MANAFRELFYGMRFFACAPIGAACIGPMLFIGPGSSYEENLRQEVMALVVGTAIGGGGWLVFKYRFLIPRETEALTIPKLRSNNFTPSPRA
jgi:hypothetical protein